MAAIPIPKRMSGMGGRLGLRLRKEGKRPCLAMPEIIPDTAISKAFKAAQLPASTTNPMMNLPFWPMICLAASMWGTVVSANLLGATWVMETRPHRVKIIATRTIPRVMDLINLVG